MFNGFINNQSGSKYSAGAGHPIGPHDLSHHVVRLVLSTDLLHNTFRVFNLLQVAFNFLDQFLFLLVGPRLVQSD